MIDSHLHNTFGNISTSTILFLIAIETCLSRSSQILVKLVIAWLPIITLLRTIGLIYLLFPFPIYHNLKVFGVVQNCHHFHKSRGLHRVPWGRGQCMVSGRFLKKIDYDAFHYHTGSLKSNVQPNDMSSQSSRWRAKWLQTNETSDQ